MRHALVYLLFGVAACGAAAEPLLIPRRTATTARQPVTTTPWVTFDDKYFYVAMRCDDPDRKKIRAPYVDRDHVFGDQDNVGVSRLAPLQLQAELADPPLRGLRRRRHPRRAAVIRVNSGGMAAALHIG